MCALIVPGPLISEARGSVSDMTFTRNRGGAYVKMKASPTQSVSSRAVAARDRVSQANLWWNAFSDAQRLKWIQYAISVETRSKSILKSPLIGRSLFIKKSLQSQIFWDSDPPNISSLVLPVNLSISFNSSEFPDISMSVEADQYSYSIGYLFYVYKPLSLGAMSPNTSFKLLGGIEFLGSASEILITDYIADAFGPASYYPDKRCFVGVQAFTLYDPDLGSWPDSLIWNPCSNFVIASFTT